MKRIAEGLPAANATITFPIFTVYHVSNVWPKNKPEVDGFWRLVLLTEESVGVPK